MTDRIVNQRSLVHYDPTSGEIRQISSVSVNPGVPLNVLTHSGLMVAEVRGVTRGMPELAQWERVADVEFYGEEYPLARLVEKTREERRALLEEWEVKVERVRELGMTDGEVNLPTDRPHPAGYEEKLVYRQQVRDLGKIGDPPGQVDAFPLRPDGVDPIPQLRARIS